MKFVNRAQWRARAARSLASSIVSQGTTGHWEGGGIWGGRIGDHASCDTKVRAIQAYHMDHNGWSDIAYNAVACPHGFVYEGRGPGRRSAANGTNYSNGQSAVVCYLGGVGDPFTEEGKAAMVDAAEYLKRDLVWGHRDWYNTQCPGDEIYNWVHAGHPISRPSEQPPVPPVEEDQMKLWLMKMHDEATVWITDLITARPISSEQELADITNLNWAQGGKMLWVPEEAHAVGTGSFRFVLKLDNRNLIDSIRKI